MGVARVGIDGNDFGMGPWRSFLTNRSTPSHPVLIHYATNRFVMGSTQLEADVNSIKAEGSLFIETGGLRIARSFMFKPSFIEAVGFRHL